MTELHKELSGISSILILGFGKEGHSTFRFIRRNYKPLLIGIADRDPGVEELFMAGFPGEKVEFHTGGDYLQAVQHYELVIKSPGVGLPQEMHGTIYGKITSQTGLMLKAFNRQIIGVTGTKGKSTTSSLIHHILKEAGKDTILVGNIGTPPFDHIEKINPETKIVYELSSHMLEDTLQAPHIAVLLNLFPEHLDRYPSLESYYNAKMKILSGQQDGDTFIYNGDIPEIAHRLTGLGPERKFLSFSAGIPVDNGCYLSGDTVIYNENGIPVEWVRFDEQFALRGSHNRMNMMAAVLAAKSAGTGDADIRNGLKTFRGLEHRLEYVGRFRDILFFNDSIATIPEAAIAAVKSLPDTETIILGGYDRGLEYGQLVDFLCGSKVKNFILLGQAGLRMLDLFRLRPIPEKQFHLVGDLEEAFRIIPEITSPGKICLLSPAAASYDIFKNFEERGNVFKKMARNL